MSNILRGITVQELIDTLTHEVAEEDRGNAILEFFIIENGKEIDLDIKSMSGFSISPDIVIELEQVEKPLITPAILKHNFIKKQHEIETDIEFRGKMPHRTFE